MTHSHSSHFFFLNPDSTHHFVFSFLSEFRQPSDPSGRAEIQSRKGSVCLPVEDSRAHSLFLESTDPLEPSGVFGIRLRRTKLMSGLNNLKYL
ncbi:hypothetical protein ILYODFUR_036565 [Ilyodon furcidens]|uniref:Uncharacterized protein n=1 Tax=Ilyodon furcidens TaxID=33524 RepID=A0ABV0VMS0_9TELE